MLDVPEFIEKADNIYGYKNFVNDAGGSLCELDSSGVIETLAEHTIILYLKASKGLENTLIKRARENPKPLYYRESFLSENLEAFITETGVMDIENIQPDEFVTWMFPRLFLSRLPRYEAIANRYGYTIDAEKIYKIRSEQDFLDLVAKAISAQT
jgi:hypothetical protein